MELLALWALLAAFVGYFAHTKGHSPIVFFLVSLFLSPVIGFIAVAIMKPNKEAIEERMMAYDQHKRCPFCKEIVKFEATRCSHCGAELNE